jgi:hypothetical protein
VCILAMQRPGECLKLLDNKALFIGKIKDNHAKHNSYGNTKCEFFTKMK